MLKVQIQPQTTVLDEKKGTGVIYTLVSLRVKTALGKQTYIKTQFTNKGLSVFNKNFLEQY